MGATHAQQGPSLLQTEAALSRLEGVRAGLDEALQMVETLRKWPAPGERGDSALIVLRTLSRELESRIAGTDQQIKQAVRARDAVLYPDRGGDPDGDSLVGRDF